MNINSIRSRIKWCIAIPLYILLFAVSYYYFYTKNTKTLSNSTVIISMKDHTYEYGEIVEGTILKQKYVIKNDSDTILKMQKKVYCGCTKAILSKEVVNPNETTTLTIWLDTKGKSGDIDEFVDITTNDSKNAFFRLGVTADVKNEIEISPGRFWFGEARKNTTIEKIITFSKRNDEKFDIKTIEVPDGVEYKIGQKAIKDGITVIPVQITLHTGDTLGIYQRDITVTTKRSKKKEHKITVSGEIIPDLKVIPAFIDVKDIAQGEIVEKKIRLLPVSDQIQNVSANSNNKNITIGTIHRDKEEYILTFRVKIPNQESSIQDTIKVFYNSNKESEILIPISVKPANITST